MTRPGVFGPGGDGATPDLNDVCRGGPWELHECPGTTDGGETGVVWHGLGLGLWLQMGVMIRAANGVRARAANVA